MEVRVIQQSKPFIGSGCTFYAKSPGAPAPTKVSTERGRRRQGVRNARKAA